jgi:RNA polymerase sigma-70 factor (ECF subfamily)
MKRIFINGALNQYRKGHLKYDHVEFEPELHEAYVGKVDEDESFGEMSGDRLLRAVQELPEQYRIIINLHIVDGLGHRQIAAMLNTTEGNSKSRLSRARVMLKEILTKRK